MDCLSLGKSERRNVIYESTKTYGNERGLSCCFRQWKATSHCKYLHGYSLGFRFTFEAERLDSRNWVYDFGSFKEIRKWVKDNFDHTLLIAKDDPEKDFLMSIDDKKIAKVIELPDVGCEKFAEYTYNFVNEYISSETSGRVKLISVEVFSHRRKQTFIKWQIFVLLYVL